MKILYLLSSFNITGGTPKKTLELIRHSNEECFVYAWSMGDVPEKHNEFKLKFTATKASIHEGLYGRNVYRHIKILLKLIDKNDIQILQTQFNFGEFLGSILKIFRPRLVLIIAFVSAEEPPPLKRKILSYVYKKVDGFVFISDFVKREKIEQFPIINEKFSRVIFNGTEKLISNDSNVVKLSNRSILSVSGLNKYKNLTTIIRAISIIVYTYKRKDIFLYIAGEGILRKELEREIFELHLKKHVVLLGSMTNVASLLDQCEIFVHPADFEGFGIAVIEAMMAGKSIIVSNSGALPEIIDDNLNGRIVEPYDENAWARAILDLIDDNDYRIKLSSNAKKKAMENFTIQNCVTNYEDYYREILIINKRIIGNSPINNGAQK